MDKNKLKELAQKYRESIIVGMMILRDPDILEAISKEEMWRIKENERILALANKEFERYKKKVEHETALDYASK